jgi:hypothetical protein
MSDLLVERNRNNSLIEVVAICNFCDEKIRPLYENSEFEDCHGWNHVVDVYRRFLEFSEFFRDCPIYHNVLKIGALAAATHDISLTMNIKRSEHHLKSAEWVRNNLALMLTEYFIENPTRIYFEVKEYDERIKNLVEITEVVALTHRSSNNLCEKEPMPPTLRDICRIFNDADNFSTMGVESKIDRYINPARIRKGFDASKKSIHKDFKDKFGKSGYGRPKSAHVEKLIAQGKFPEFDALMEVAEDREYFYSLLYKRWLIKIQNKNNELLRGKLDVTIEELQKFYPDPYNAIK